jgi:hypothetical protein
MLRGARRAGEAHRTGARAPERVHAQEEPIQRRRDHEAEFALGNALAVEEHLDLVRREHPVAGPQHRLPDQARRHQAGPEHAVVASFREEPVGEGDGALDHAGAEEHPVLHREAAVVGDPQHRPAHHALRQAPRAHRLQHGGQALDRVTLGAQIERRHVGPTVPQGAIIGIRSKSSPARISVRSVLERAIPPVHHQQIDAAPREIGQRLRERGRMVRFHVHHVGIGAEQREHTGDRLPALARSQIVQNADFHG